MPSIKPILCTNCKKSGWPGDGNFQSETDKFGTTVYCKCGHVIPIESPRDYNILSTNDLVRLYEASNQSEFGDVELIPGKTASIEFRSKFDYICKVFFTPQAPVIVKEYSLTLTGMRLISSPLAANLTKSKVSYYVCGLVDLDTISTWYILFYSAISDNINGLYKMAILNYSASFEAFLDEYLRELLTKQHGEDMANYLLEKEWRVEEKCKSLLSLATKHKLSEENEIYQPWDENVRTIRNKLMHGNILSVNREDAEKAHSATYQAIRWVQNLPST